MPRQTEDVSLLLAAETLAAKAELEKAGYNLAGRPLFPLPRLPHKLTEQDDDALMQLMTELQAWSRHIGGLLALQEIDERVTESIYKMAFEAVLATTAPSKASEGTMTKAKAEAGQHHQVREAAEARDMAYARRKLIKQMYENLEEDKFLCSRELSRRLGRHEVNERRLDRYRP